jgi:hypothetical protein
MSRSYNNHVKSTMFSIRQLRIITAFKTVRGAKSDPLRSAFHRTGPGKGPKDALCPRNNMAYNTDIHFEGE